MLTKTVRNRVQVHARKATQSDIAQDFRSW